MENLLTPAITIGPVVLGLGLLCTVACIVAYLLRPRAKADAVLLRFVVLAVAIGVGAFVAGSAIGIAAFCASADSGNLCGLGGVFGMGPLLSGLAMGGYAWSWFRGAMSRSRD
jgi:hypothetical protein